MSRSLGATAFIPQWNECRGHLGLAGRLQSSRHVEPGAMRTACSLAHSDARNTGAQPRRLIAATNRPMRVMLGLQPRRSRAAKIAGKLARPLARAAESKPRRQLRLQYRCSFPPVCRGLNRFSTPQAGRRGFSRHDACSFGRAAAIKSPARAIARAGESAGPVAGPTSPSSISPRRFEKPLSSRRVWARTGNRSSPPCRAA